MLDGFYGCWKHAGYISQNVGILYTDSIGIWWQTGRGEGRVFCRLLKSPERLWLESRKNLTTNMWVESLRYALFYCSLKSCYLVPHTIFKSCARKTPPHEDQSTIKTTYVWFQCKYVLLSRSCVYLDHYLSVEVMAQFQNVMIPKTFFTPIFLSNFVCLCKDM